jgi:hypothetical protein
MKIGLKDLQDLTQRLYLELGYPEAQIETILDVLSYAHRRGNFQSLIQEVAFGTPRFNAQREIVVEKETSLSCLIDAGGNIGICALHFAADLLVNKAKTSGFAIIGIHNSSPPGTGPARLLRGKNRAGRLHWLGFLRFKQDGRAEREQRTRFGEQSDRDWNSHRRRTHGPGHGDLCDADF